MAMVSAIQEAQKDNLRSFNDYMMKVLEVCGVVFYLYFYNWGYDQTILGYLCMNEEGIVA